MNNLEYTKSESINAIIGQMRAQNITLSELARAWKNQATDASGNKKDLAARLFTILGGIFLFSGVAVYTAMFWNEMNGTMHILITLGVGLVVQALAFLAEQNGNYPRAVKPLQLIALVLQPTGWFVAIHELFPEGQDVRRAILFVMALMAIQQGAIFYAQRSTFILFAAIAFAYFGAFDLFDLIHANENMVMVSMGISMMAIAQALRPTSHAAISQAGYFIGGACFYFGAFELLRDTPMEVVYLAITCGLIYLSTVVRSGALLAISTIAMLGYIGYFTDKHFVHSIGWPLSLVILGCVFFAIGGFAVRLKKRYLSVK